MSQESFRLGDGIQTVDGILERVAFHDEESGWSVVRVEVVVTDRREVITCVGSFLGVQPGESLRLSGRWVNDKRFGDQLRVDSYVTMRPATLVGIERYLGSGLVQGIGKAMAGRLVGHFGLETLDVIENHGERLTEVAGIGPVRSRRIRDAWVEQREIQEVMVFLSSHGVSTSFAVKIWKTYGKQAIATVREDPYRLALDIYGIGFRTADRIAASLGISPSSERRAEAGVLHSLGEASDDGHCYSPRPRLVELVGELLRVDDKVIDIAILEAAIDRLALTERLVVEAIADGEVAVYLKSLHTAEVGAAGRLGLLMSVPPTPITVDVARALEWFEQQQSIALAPEQRAAIEAAVTAKVLVITGGPGTGKTTIINGIIRILEKKGRRILLSAPTGRAAKRMNQTTDREARTVHRLLEFQPKAGGFQRHQGRPLEADVLIVDEASMLDLPLFYSILKAVPPSCQLILVGDVDQLPSVGPGSVLRDVIGSRACKVVTLTEIFRQAAASLIITNAHRVNRGQLPLRQAQGERSEGVEGEGEGEADFFWIERDEPEEVVKTIKELVGERIPRRFGVDGIDDVQVLTPMHRGALGAATLNAELQELLNPAKPDAPSLQRAGRSFRGGDKVMQLRNNYDLDVFNGDIGRVTAVDEEERQLKVSFEGREVCYEQGDLDELVLAYACSIHKSQGSEYPVVVVPLHTQHYVMLQRNLLYTALTRGRRLVVLVGSRRAVSIAVRTQREGKRNTRLAERLAIR